MPQFEIEETLIIAIHPEQVGVRLRKEQFARNRIPPKGTLFAERVIP